MPPPPVLSAFVLACYFAAALWLAGSRHNVTGHTGRMRLTIGLTLSMVALALHGFVLWRGVAAKPAFALSIAESASLVGFGTAGVAILVCWRKASFAGASAVLLIIAGLVAAVTNDGSRQFALEQHGWELTAHIVLSILAYSLITVGTALAIALALLDRRLRTHQPLGWLSIFPPVVALESGMFTALSIGFALLSLALFSGFFFVQDIFAQSLSRKIVLSCIAWIMLAILLFGRWRFGWRGRIARNWTIGGFVVLCLAYFGSKVVLESILGRHWG